MHTRVSTALALWVAQRSTVSAGRGHPNCAATGERVTTAGANDRSTGLLDAFLVAGAELVQDGAGRSINANWRRIDVHCHGVPFPALAKREGVSPSYFTRLPGRKPRSPDVLFTFRAA